jgi:VCBS repeat-containing protein
VQVAGTVTANAANGVLANDTDPIPNDTLIVSAVDGQASNVGHALVGSYGTLTLNVDGSYSYVANQSVPSNIIEQDVFTYTATDGDGGSATSSLTITITQAGQTYIAGTPGQALTSGNGSVFLDGSLLQNQTITAGNGNDAVIAGSNDTITLGNGNDVVDAGDSNTIKLGNGTDTVTAGVNSTLTLGNGADTVTAGANSIVTAGNGNDTVAAGANSTITFGNGNDTVTAVSSLIQAGKGHDSFIFTGSFGQNTITNFNTALDTIQLSSSEFANFAAVQNHMQQVGANTVITYDAGDAITLAGVKISSLHASDFHFV